MAGGSHSVLVVEDDEDLSGFLRRALEQSGLVVRTALTGRAALEDVERATPDLLLLDLDLPDVDGMDVLEHVRATRPVPVIVLSGRRSELDRVRGLDLGADDYVVKPFSLKELEARIRAVLRRAATDVGSSVIEHGPLQLDPVARLASIDGTPLELTRREFDLLAHLASNPQRVFTRHELLVAVWHSSIDWQQDATVTEHIRRIRRKIEVDHGCPRLVHNVRGLGYRFGVSESGSA